MNAVEFNAELSGGATIHLPSADDADWRTAAYQQFLRDDAPGDAIYETSSASQRLGEQNHREEKTQVAKSLFGAD